MVLSALIRRVMLFLSLGVLSLASSAAGLLALTSLAPLVGLARLLGVASLVHGLFLLVHGLLRALLLLGLLGAASLLAGRSLGAALGHLLTLGCLSLARGSFDPGLGGRLLGGSSLGGFCLGGFSLAGLLHGGFGFLDGLGGLSLLERLEELVSVVGGEFESLGAH